MSKHEKKTAVADLLAAYEMGLLDDADRRRFEKATLEDPDLLDELFEMAPHAQAIVERPAEVHAAAREALDAARGSAGSRLKAVFARLFSPRVLVPAAVAAALVLALLNLDQGGGELRALASLDPLPYAEVAVRGDEPDRERLYLEAMIAYADSRFGTAATGLTTAIDEYEGTWSHLQQARLYLGVSLLQLDRPVEAVSRLEAGAESPIPPIADGSRWYLAQAYLMQENEMEAVSLLETLRDGSPVYGTAAGDLLARIDALQAD